MTNNQELGTRNQKQCVPHRALSRKALSLPAVSEPNRTKGIHHTISYHRHTLGDINNKNNPRHRDHLRKVFQGAGSNVPIKSVSIGACPEILRKRKYFLFAWDEPSLLANFTNQTNLTPRVILSGAQRSRKPSASEMMPTGARNLASDGDSELFSVSLGDLMQQH
jgi:hypothetical protein